MKKILVPTDFSAPSKASFRFATGLASKAHADVYVVHMIRLPLLPETTFGIQPYPSDPALLEDAIRAAYRQFEDLKRQFPSDPLSPADIDALDREMIRMSGEKLDTLKNDIHRHEQKLREVFSIFSAGDENQYRHTHRELLQRIHELQQEMRDFKKRIFAFIR